MTEPLGADYKRASSTTTAPPSSRATPPTRLSIVAPTLRVTAPNGGESLIFGAQTQATWTVGNATLSVGSFDLEAVSPTKGTYTLNASPIAVDPAKTGYSFAWTVAQPLGPTTSCTSSTTTARAADRDDDSDLTFAIVAPPTGTDARASRRSATTRTWPPVRWD